MAMEEDKNYINMIHGDLARASQVQSGMPENVGVMNIKTANRTIPLDLQSKNKGREIIPTFVSVNQRREVNYVSY